MEDFYHRFKQEEAALHEVINSIPNGKLTQEEKKIAVDKSITAISQLSNKVKDAAGSLPAHDLQTYSKAIDYVTKRLQEVRTAAEPKKKFAFKKSSFLAPVAGLSSTKTSPATASPNDEIKQSNADPGKPEQKQSLGPTAQAYTGFRLSCLEATHYVLKSSVSDAASVASVKDIQGSVIDISIPASIQASFATLVVTNVKDSLLISGTIPGSAHITGVNDSTIVIMAQQIRIHDCRNVVIYLYCSSRPIIEDCTEIRFAPLPAIFATEAIRGQRNMWDQVDDFKWLRAEPSPNWSLLTPDDDRAIFEESWKEISRGDSPVLGVDELLELARLRR